MSQVWDCDYCKCVTRKPGPNCKNLNCSCHPAQNLQQQLEAAKLREAELERRNEHLLSVLEMANTTAIRRGAERDAALSALEIARTALQNIKNIALNHSGSDWDNLYDFAKQAFNASKSPSAALAARDWAKGDE